MPRLPHCAQGQTECRDDPPLPEERARSIEAA
jgi:hypothetical protein